MKNSQFLPSLLLLLTAAFVMPAANSKAVAKEPPAFYLNRETALLNCYYTVEYFEPSPMLPSSLGAAQIEPKRVANLEQFLTYLKKELPEAEISTDGVNPKVIHIADRRLLHRKDYGLNKSINIAFNGSLSGLPKAISSLTKDDVSYLNSTNSAIISLYAENKNVSLSLQNTSSREVLTTATFTPSCSNELWEAYSSVVDGKISTSVYFSTPSR